MADSASYSHSRLHCWPALEIPFMSYCKIIMGKKNEYIISL